MRIFTSSWATTLPDTIQKIGISRGTPRRYPPGYKRLMALAPGPWLDVGDIEFRERYARQLEQLDARVILEKLAEIAQGRDIALLCYESDPAACHRSQAGRWLHDELSIDVVEYDPKLPPQFRR
jgi:hypothetical protein